MNHLLYYKNFLNEQTKYTVGPLFHGGSTKFELFDFNKLGKDGHLLSFLGCHFSEDEIVAERFMNPPDYVIYEVELKVNKPLIIKEGDLVRNMLKFGVENNIINKYIFNRQNRIFDEILKLPYYEISQETISHKLLYLKSEDSKKISLSYKDYLIKQGYDSIKYENEIELPEIDRFDWIAFNENQIKIIHVWDQKPMLNP